MSARVLVGRALACAVLLSAFMDFGLAQSDVAKGTSLELAPANAAFYAGTYRTGEQFRAFGNSPSMAKFLKSPWGTAVSEGWKEWNRPQGDPDPEVPPELMKQEAGQAIMAIRQARNELDKAAPGVGRMMVDQAYTFFTDAFSNDMFLFGSDFESFGPVLEELKRLSSAIQQSGKDPNDGSSSEERIAREIGKIDLGALKSSKIPTIIGGAKLTNRDTFMTYLTLAETTIRAGLGSQPEWQKLQSRLKRHTKGDINFLSFELDGKLIPRDELKLAEAPPEVRKKAEEMLDILKDKKLTICVGMYKNYAMLAIVDSFATIEKLESGPRLVDTPDFAPLRKHAGKPLAGVSYMRPGIQGTSGSPFGLDNYSELIKNAPEHLRERLIADFEELKVDLLPYSQQVNWPAMQFSLFTSEGYESYTYGTNSIWSDAEPLTIADHVGGAPLIAIAGRQKYSPDAWKLLVKWAKRGNHYIDEGTILKEMPDDEKQQFLEGLGLARPLLERFEKITSEKFLPSMKDGQSAFVLDTSIRNTQFSPLMPKAAKPLTLPLPAFVWGVSDANLLTSAAADYRVLLNDALAIAREKADMAEKVPPDLPPPESRDVTGGKMYYYSPPEGTPVDTWVLPNASLSDKFVTISLSEKISANLLKPQPFTAWGPAGKKDRPVASAAYVDVGGFVDVISDWIVYAIDQGAFDAGAEFDPTGADVEEPKPEAPTAWRNKLKDNIPPILGLLKFQPVYSTATYREGEQWVTHSAWKFETPVESASK